MAKRMKKAWYAVFYQGQIEIAGPVYDPAAACEKAFEQVNDAMRVLLVAERFRDIPPLASLPAEPARTWNVLRTYQASTSEMCRRCGQQINKADEVVLVDRYLEPTLGLRLTETTWVHCHCEPGLGVVPIVDPPELDHWTSLLEEVKVPLDLLPAIACGRPELLILAQARPLAEHECKAVIDLIRVLLETNQSLQRRCEELYRIVGAINAEAATARDALRSLSTHCERLVEGARWGDPVETDHD